MESIAISSRDARRLFIAKQHLVGRISKGSFPDMVNSVVRDTTYIQWDPVTVVAPSHIISLWSRIGDFDWNRLEDLMWERKQIFLHWTPIALLVLMDDYPLFYSLMKRYPHSLGKSWRSHIATAREFMDSHAELKEQVINRLKKGPAEIKQFSNFGRRSRSVDGWSSGNEVTTLLHHLHMMGEVMVSGHVRNQNLWSLTDDFLPDPSLKEEMSPEDLEKATALRALKALGVAPEFDINRYFVRGRYWHLDNALRDLESDGSILRAEIEGVSGRHRYFILPEDVQALQSLDKHEWDENIRIIPPFDNIVTIRERLKRLFNFDYTLEQFLPKDKRKYGTYVLPILWKDRLVGRFDAKLDKEEGILNIKSIHSEPGFESDFDIPQNLNGKILEFANFLHADRVSYGDKIPEGWKRYLG